VSIGFFSLMLIVVHLEKSRGKRFFASNARTWLDKTVLSFEQKITSNWSHFIRYIVQLHWYYSIHSVLKAILHAMQFCYFSFEKIFERNRARAKKLRAERREINLMSHLGQVAEHKEETSLTDAQKRKLRHKKLEEKH
jgi:hypothetical protein